VEASNRKIKEAIATKEKEMQALLASMELNPQC
jgi:hypothetical protein